MFRTLRDIAGKIGIVRIIVIVTGVAFVSACFVYPSGDPLHNLPGLAGLSMLVFGIFWPWIRKATAKGWKRVARIILIGLIILYVSTFAAMCLAI